MWPWRKKKEPEIVFLDGGKEPDYKKIRQLTQEEIDTEIMDLAEHYKNVAILLPIPAQLQFEVLKHD